MISAVSTWFQKEFPGRSEEHTSELQSRLHLVCRLLLETKKLASLQIDVIIVTSGRLPGPILVSLFADTSLSSSVTPGDSCRKDLCSLICSSAIKSVSAF